MTFFHLIVRLGISVQIHQVKVSREGRVLIPNAVRIALGLEVGSCLNLAVENGEIRLFDQAQALRRARQITHKFRSKESSVVDELLADRRAEAQRS